MTTPILIFTEEKNQTPRLNFVLKWIFEEQLGLSYEICNQPESLAEFSDSFRINYSEQNLVDADLKIKPQGLLAQTGVIQKQILSFQRWKKNAVIFYNQPGKKVPFDLFSAVFYLISRYEEYLPFKADKHNRFPSEASCAFEYNFLTDPVIDQWLFHFGKLIEVKQTLNKRPFECKITYDIDMAWKYRNRGRKRYWGGQAKDLSQFQFRAILNRFMIVNGKKPDPFYSFPLLEQLEQKYQLDPIYFFLIGKEGKFDRNIPGKHAEMQKLIQHIAGQHQIGIHPSYGSHQDKDIVKEEVSLLSTIIKKTVTASRQHFIKFRFPDTFRNLLDNGITEDYSMGYPEINGFRAGTTRPFNWYDLAAEKETNLRIHPFIFMDATSRFYLKQSPEEALKEWKKLFIKVQSVQGCFISIWHNYILSLDESWVNSYKQALAYWKGR